MKKNSVKKFLSYYKPYRKLFAADLFFACLGAAITLILPLIIRWITTDIVYRPADEALNLILMLSLLMVALILVECYCNYFIANYGHVMGACMEHDMRNEIFSHYQKLSFRFFNDQKVGHLMTRITNDLFDISELLHHGPEDLLISLIKLIGSFLILLSIHWKLALVAFLVVPPIIIYAAILNIRMKRAFKRNRARVSDINAQIEDSLSGIRVVKSFANEAIEEAKFQEGNDRWLDSKKDSYRYMGLYHSGLGAFTTLISVLVIAAGAFLITQGSVKVADLVTFLLYINNFTEPIKKLINFTEQFQNGASGYSRFMEMLAVEPDVKECESPLSLSEVKGEIRFENVTFRYEDDITPVFNGLDLTVAPGEYLALVGPSGVGKSTLCNLIPRFYDPEEGEISIDGLDIRQLSLQSLRQHIGIVQQDVYLFAGTVMDNIRYGKPDATDEEIIEAAKLANAHEFICELPEGYQSNIGQRGVKLSGGQKQRLSIARVFLKNPPILIFDEATSALDNESEKVVQDSLETLAGGRTTFVIAHRLSTIRNADRILVMTEQGIAEQGTHEELLAKDGVYANLYRMQFTGKKSAQPKEALPQA